MRCIFALVEAVLKGSFFFCRQAARVTEVKEKPDWSVISTTQWDVFFRVLAVLDALLWSFPVLKATAKKEKSIFTLSGPPEPVVLSIVFCLSGDCTCKRGRLLFAALPSPLPPVSTPLSCNNIKIQQAKQFTKFIELINLNNKRLAPRGIESPIFLFGKGAFFPKTLKR
jgi:hypothetical protein